MASRALALLLLGAPMNVSFVFFLWPKVYKINPKASALAEARGHSADNRPLTSRSDLLELALAQPFQFSFI